MPFPGEAGSPRTYHLARSLAPRHKLTLLQVTGRTGPWNDTEKYQSVDSPFSGVAKVVVESNAGSTLGKVANAVCGNPWFVTRHERKSEYLSAVAAVRALCRDADAVWVDGLPLLQYAEGCGPPIVVDETDYMSRLMFVQASMAGSRTRRLVDSVRALLIRRYEKLHLRRADAVTLISSIEAQLMRSEIGVEAHLVMNGCDTSFFAPSAERVPLPGQPALVFVANFPYQPNRDAAEYIVRELSTGLVERFPEVRIYLVGPPPEGGFGQVPGCIEATGFVEDVRRYYAGADVFICPLRFGGGVKNKILEAAAMGCPIVASDISMEGIGFADGVHFLQAATPAGYVEAVAKMVADEGAYGHLLGRRARETVEHEYSWESEGNKFESVLVAAAARHRARQPPPSLTAVSGADHV